MKCEDCNSTFGGAMAFHRHIDPETGECLPVARLPEVGLKQSSTNAWHVGGMPRTTRAVTSVLQR